MVSGGLKVGANKQLYFCTAWSPIRQVHFIPCYVGTPWNITQDEIKYDDLLDIPNHLHHYVPSRHAAMILNSHLASLVVTN